MANYSSPPTSRSPQPRGQQQPVRLLRQPIPWLQAFWKFSRPHTIIGTSFSVAALLAIALRPAVIASGPDPSLGATFSAWPSWGSLIMAWLVAWVACLAGNVYIVGLNQMEDVAIDRINKPHLPLASGEFTQGQARRLVGLTGVSAIALAILSGGPFLIFTVVASLLIGTAYSLPPVRLKRFPFWASLCILVVRGALVNLGLYLHFYSHFWPAEPLTIPARVWALTLFMLVFGFVIAIFKDIPDIEGDRQFNIATYSLRLGRKKVFNLARWLLTGCYVALMAAAPFLPAIAPLFLVLAQVVSLASFWWLSRRVDLDPSPGPKNISYRAFYQFIWKLFFAEYLLFPLACWLANG